MAVLGVLVGWAWGARVPREWRGLRRRPRDIPAVWRRMEDGGGLLIFPKDIPLSELEAITEQLNARNTDLAMTASEDNHDAVPSPPERP